MVTIAVVTACWSYESLHPLISLCLPLYASSPPLPGGHVPQRTRTRRRGHLGECARSARNRQMSGVRPEPISTVRGVGKPSYGFVVGFLFCLTRSSRISPRNSSECHQNFTRVSPEFPRNFTIMSPDVRQNVEFEHLKKGNNHSSALQQFKGFLPGQREIPEVLTRGSQYCGSPPHKEGQPRPPR